MSALEHSWSDPDRREGALQRLGAVVQHSDRLYPERHTVTTRERQILQALSFGLGARGVADVLGIQVETVRTHTRHARAALRAKNTTHAVAEALRQGLIQ